MSSRRRHVGNRENPPSGRCIGVFGLSIYTQERDLKEVFTKYGPLEDVQIVYDAQTGRSRGFAFVYFENKNDANEVSLLFVSIVFTRWDNSDLICCLPRLRSVATALTSVDAKFA